MWGHEFVASVAGMLLSLMAPIANTALVAPSTGGLDCGLWLSQSGVSAGTSVQLTWWTMNAVHATLVDGTSGSTNVALSGTIAFTPSSSRTYTLIAHSAQGITKSCTAQITVSPSSSAAPSCGISASPGVHYAGQPLQLVWYSQNATAAQISNLGTIPPNQLAQGTATVAPQQTTLYTMQVANASASRTCSALVTITPRPGTTAPSYSTPTYTPSTSYVYSRPTYSTTPRTSYSSPSFSSPSYSYSRPWSSGSSYGSSYDYSPRSTTYESWDTWESPSYSSGLGDYSLTNIWNDVGSGDLMITNHDCSGYYCDSEPYSWGYASHIQADGNEGSTPTYRVGWYDDQGPIQGTFDYNGNLVGAGGEISNSLFESTPSDGSSGWYYAGGPDAGLSSQPEIQTFGPDTSSEIYSPTLNEITPYNGTDYGSYYPQPPAGSVQQYFAPTVYDSGYNDAVAYPEFQSYQGSWTSPALQNNESNYYNAYDFPTDSLGNLQFDE